MSMDYFINLYCGIIKMSEKKKFDFKKIKKHAQDLRKNMTSSEKLLWKELRGRRLSGYKFLRQHPILYNGNLLRFNYFVADFYCDSKKTIIELDGPVHNCTIEYDLYRDSELINLGFRILRVKNEELEDMNKTKEKILAFLDSIF
jgi:very-short-patch-repair endonuclease